MGIQEILGNAGPVDPVKGNRSESSDKVKSKTYDEDDKKDSVEVSMEARALYDADKTRRFEAIREKIRNGFYFQRDVTDKVVDAMMKDLKKTS
jgi:anti-sigma28 factor (negative regulator of flagellin synthesis)